MTSMKPTFSAIFYPRKSEVNKNGKVTIMGKITVNGERVQFSTKLLIDPDNWDSRMGKAKIRSEEGKEVNRLLDAMRKTINDQYFKLIEEYGYASPEKIKNVILGIDKEYKTLLEFIRAHNEMYSQKVGITTSQITHRRYKQVETRMQEFLKKEYKVSDISIREVNPIFLDKLYLFLRKDCGVQNNYAMKFMQRVSRIYNFARNSGLQLPDPFDSFNIRFEKEKRTAITQEELDIIRTKELITERLDQVRDAFIFSCYTGISFIDVAQLNESHLQTGFDGQLWIMLHRHKTGGTSNVKLLDIPKQIIEKYRGRQKNGALLPVMSNQKTNEYLKEIASLCGINKRITYHMSRHTFATTVALNNGVPLESVSKMLGHESIKTTEIYAKVTDFKVGKDMDALAKNIESEPKKAFSLSIDIRFECLSSEEKMMLFNLPQSLAFNDNRNERLNKIWFGLSEEEKESLWQQTFDGAKATV